MCIQRRRPWKDSTGQAKPRAVSRVRSRAGLQSGAGDSEASGQPQPAEEATVTEIRWCCLCLLCCRQEATGPAAWKSQDPFPPLGGCWAQPGTHNLGCLSVPYPAWRRQGLLSPWCWKGTKSIPPHCSEASNLSTPSWGPGYPQVVLKDTLVPTHDLHAQEAPSLHSGSLHPVPCHRLPQGLNWHMPQGLCTCFGRARPFLWALMGFTCTRWLCQVERHPPPPAHSAVGCSAFPLPRALVSS